MSSNPGSNGLRERMKTSAALAGVGLACVALAAGCTGYRLGTTLPAGLKSIDVPVFVNKCGEPQIENDATDAAKKEFQKEGSLSIVGADEADLTLEVTLVKYALEPLRYEKNDQKTTKEYRLKLTADMVLTRVKGKKVLLKTQVEGRSTFYPGGDLASAKRLALPKAAADLAHQIVENVVESW